MVTNEISQAPRYFYHSFARPKSDNSDENFEKSFRILQNIKEFGLILAPEIVTWDISLIDKTTKIIRFRQSRISFTELSESELKEHTKVFGPISIEFDLQTLRAMGAQPVIYVPKEMQADKSFANTFVGAGQTAIWLLRMSWNLLGLLENIQKHIETARQQNVPVTLHSYSKSTGSENISQIHPDELEKVIQFLSFERAPFDKLMGGLHFFSSLLYPADNHYRNDILGYYRQREWRILPGLIAGNEALTQPLDIERISRLISIDNEFWSKSIEDDEKSFVRAEEAFCISTFNGKPIHEFIRRVFVPEKYKNKAEDLFPRKIHII